MDNTMIDINDVILESGMATEMIDYTELAMASLLETLQEYKKLEMFELIKESEWVQECLECGFILPVMIPLFEAEGDQTNVTTTGDNNADAANNGRAIAKGINLRDLSNAIKLWMDKLTTKINQVIIKRSRKYVPWVNDIKDLLKPGLSKIPAGNTIKMSPYYDGKWQQDVSTCIDSFNKIARNIQAKDYQDFSFAQNIVDPGEVAARTSKVANLIKNYFRYGVKNTTEIKQDALTGQDLAKYIDDMVSYLIGYEKAVTNNVNKISKAYNPNKIQAAVKNADNSPAAEGNTESMMFYSPDTMLSIEECTVAESMLSTLINYPSIAMEKTNTSINGTGMKYKSDEEIEKNRQQDAENRANGNTRDDGKTNGKDTNVEVTDKQGEEVKPGQQTETGKKGTNSALVNYMHSVEYYVKLVISGYATACDERFITYLNVIKVIAKYAGIPNPKFDIHGNYDATNKSNNKNDADNQNDNAGEKNTDNGNNDDNEKDTTTTPKKKTNILNKIKNIGKKTK